MGVLAESVWRPASACTLQIQTIRALPHTYSNCLLPRLLPFLLPLLLLLLFAFYCAEDALQLFLVLARVVSTPDTNHTANQKWHQ